MKNIMRILAVLLVIGLLIFIMSNNFTEPVSEAEIEGVLEVHFIDVGQADAILIKGSTESMLIDAGNNGDGKLVVDYIKKQRIENLKYVIGTHPHEDHIGGLDDVIDNFHIGQVIMPNAIANTKTFEDVLDSIAKKGLKITRPKVGDRYTLNNAEFIILAPNGEEYSNTNDYSVVVKLINGANSFLFTGDAEEKSEKEMLEKNRRILQANVLKVGHHGSTTSTSQEFLDAVNPSIAVILSEVGNSYGHPHKEIIERLDKKKVNILRIDQEGTVVIKSDGKTISYGNEALDIIEKESNETKIVISDLDKIGEIITLRNDSSEDVNLNGWKIVSERGNQEYIFPDYILKAGAVVTISSGGIKGDLNWGGENIWNNTQSDPAVLYDLMGEEAFRLNN